MGQGQRVTGRAPEAPEGDVRSQALEFGKRLGDPGMRLGCCEAWLGAGNARAAPGPKLTHPLPVCAQVLLGGGQDASQVTTTSAKAGGFEARFFHKVRLMRMNSSSLPHVHGMAQRSAAQRGLKRRMAACAQIWNGAAQHRWFSSRVEDWLAARMLLVCCISSAWSTAQGRAALRAATQRSMEHSSSAAGYRAVFQVEGYMAGQEEVSRAQGFLSAAPGADAWLSCAPGPLSRAPSALFHPLVPLQIYQEEFGNVRGHFGPINTVAFHPSGRRWASVFTDRSSLPQGMHERCHCTWVCQLLPMACCSCCMLRPAHVGCP